MRKLLLLSTLILSSSIAFAQFNGPTSQNNQGQRGPMQGQMAQNQPCPNGVDGQPCTIEQRAERQAQAPRNQMNQGQMHHPNHRGQGKNQGHMHNQNHQGQGMKQGHMHNQNHQGQGMKQGQMHNQNHHGQGMNQGQGRNNQ